MEENKTESDNTELIEAIAEMRKNYSNETQNNVINIALKSTFLVPAVVEKNKQLVADKDNHLTFNEDPQARFLLINDKNGKSYFPAFTSSEELTKLKTEEKFSAFSMTFADIAGLTENAQQQVAGFVVNPFSENLPFTQEILASIKETLIRTINERKAKEENSANEKNQ